MFVFAFVAVSVFGAQAHPSLAQINEEAQVREYFADIPVMIEIARCESQFRQFTDAGNVLRGGYNGEMIGVFQFHEPVHRGHAETLGHDLATLEGNLAYARYLYTQSGTQPWNSARACFETAVTPTPPPLTTLETEVMTDAQLRHKIDLLQQIITLLQTILALQQR